MLSHVLKTLCMTGIAGIISAAPALSQSVAPPAPAPAPAPADFPSYIVAPSEDLNPYNLSTMQKSTGIDYRQGAGTLGTSVERQSNIEVNAALEKKRQEKLKAEQDAQAKQAKAESESQAGEAQTLEITPAEPPQLGDSGKDLETPGVRSGLFTWTDDKGVLHATNDIGQVPIKYQVEALQGSSKDIDLNKDSKDQKKR